MKKLVRVLGGATAALGGAGVALSGYHSATHPFVDWPEFRTPTQKLITHYSYFTLWSNILGTAVATQYALGKRPRNWAVPRLNAVTMLAVTGVVFHALLARTSVIEGLIRVTNPIVHTFMPIAVPALWLLDRRDAETKDITAATAAWSFALPLAWSVYTFARGSQTKGYYPYEFINPRLLGYPIAVRNVALVGAVLGALIAAMAAMENQVFES